MIVPFGETALLVELDDWRASRFLAASIEAVPIPGVLEVVPGLRSVLLELDRPADAEVRELEVTGRADVDESVMRRHRQIRCA